MLRCFCMDKKLPGVFANKIDKDFQNNKHVFYSRNEGLEQVDTVNRGIQVEADTIVNVEQKINQIFQSPNYIYKADVLITTDRGKMEKRIVGKRQGNLITMENELIPISSIVDISLR